MENKTYNTIDLLNPPEISTIGPNDKPAFEKKTNEWAQYKEKYKKDIDNFRKEDRISKNNPNKIPRK